MLAHAMSTARLGPPPVPTAPAVIAVPAVPAVMAAPAAPTVMAGLDPAIRAAPVLRGWPGQARP